MESHRSLTLLVGQKSHSDSNMQITPKIAPDIHGYWVKRQGLGNRSVTGTCFKTFDNQLIETAHWKVDWSAHPRQSHCLQNRRIMKIKNYIFGGGTFAISPTTCWRLLFGWTANKLYSLVRTDSTQR